MQVSEYYSPNVSTACCHGSNFFVAENKTVHIVEDKTHFELEQLDSMIQILFVVGEYLAACTDGQIALYDMWTDIIPDSVETTTHIATETVKVHQIALIDLCRRGDNFLLLTESDIQEMSPDGNVTDIAAIDNGASIACDGEGTIAVGTADGRVCIYKDQQWSDFNVMESPITFMAYSKSILFCECYDGIYRLDDTMENAAMISEGCLIGKHQDDRVLVFLTGKGVVAYDTQGGEEVVSESQTFGIWCTDGTHLCVASQNVEVHEAASPPPAKNDTTCTIV